MSFMIVLLLRSINALMDILLSIRRSLHYGLVCLAGGNRGRELGRIGGGIGTGGGREKGRKREFKDGGMRE